MSKFKGRHRKATKLDKAVTGAAIASVGVIPIAFAGDAQAASTDAWDRIAACESSGQWNRPDGDFGKSSGGLQFQPPSWTTAVNYLRSKGVDVSSFPQGQGHQAYKATKQQQILAGEALLAAQGPGAWTCNAKSGFPLQSSGTNASMFKGGTNPYGKVTTPSKPPASVPVPKPAYKPAPPVPNNTVEKITHAVKAGDTLHKIAVLHLHNSDKDNWRSIYETNKGIIGSNPNLIFPGQVLVIPNSSPSKLPPARPPVTNTPGANTPVSNTPPPKTTVSVSSPLAKPAVSQSYGNARAGYTLGYHTGTDFSAPQGTPVKAVAAGTVVASDRSSAYGINVLIKHNDGTYSLYAHLSSKSAFLGKKVTAGMMIGTVGSTGTNSSGPHLHLEIRTSPTFGAGNFLDPIKWLRDKGLTI